MAKVYCRDHPGVALNWLGVCSRCEKEKRSNRLQEELVEEQRHANQLTQEANAESQRLQRDLISEQQATRAFLEKQDVELKERRQKELLQVGIVEFEGEFQDEWNRVAKKHKQLSELDKITYALVNNKLSKEFTEDFATERISDDLVSQIDLQYKFKRQSKKLSAINDDIAVNSKQSIEWSEWEINTNNFANVLKQYEATKAYYNGNIGYGGLFTLLLGVLFLFASVGNTSNYGYTSNSLFLYIITSILLGIGTILFLNRRVATKKQRNLNTAFKKLAELISEKYLFEKWDGALETGKFDKLDNLMNKVSHILEESYRQGYYNEKIALNSSSESASEIFLLISESEQYYSLNEFDNAVGEYSSKFKYMRKAIMDVGEEIHNGHRVPSIMRKKRIELMKCPACGGPLAKDGNSRCHYCGNEFKMH